MDGKWKFRSNFEWNIDFFFGSTQRQKKNCLHYSAPWVQRENSPTSIFDLPLPLLAALTDSLACSLPPKHVRRSILASCWAKRTHAWVTTYRNWMTEGDHITKPYLGLRISWASHCSPFPEHLHTLSRETHH